jgi:hypothetical protein
MATSAAAVPTAPDAGRAPQRDLAVDLGPTVAALAITVFTLAQDARPLGAGGVALAVGSTVPLLGWRRAPLAVFLITAAASAAIDAVGYDLGLGVAPTVMVFLLARMAAGDTIAEIDRLVDALHDDDAPAAPRGWRRWVRWSRPTARRARRLRRGVRRAPRAAGRERPGGVRDRARSAHERRAARDRRRPPELDHGPRLPGGAGCIFAEGATNVVAGQRLNYVGTHNRFGFGVPDTLHTTWRIGSRATSTAAGCARPPPASLGDDRRAASTKPPPGSAPFERAAE